MSFQGTINQGIGAIGAVAGVKKVVEGQQAGNELAEKTNELAKAQQQHLANKEVSAAERQLETAEKDVITNENDEMKKAITLDKEGWNKALHTVARNNKDKDMQTSDVLDEYQKQKLNSAEQEWAKSMFTAQMQPSKQANIRLDKAVEALNNVKGEIEARRQLKFNLKQAQSELDYAKEYQSILGGNK